MRNTCKGAWEVLVWGKKKMWNEKRQGVVFVFIAVKVKSCNYEPWRKFFFCHVVYSIYFDVFFSLSQRVYRKRLLYLPDLTCGFTPSMLLLYTIWSCLLWMYTMHKTYTRPCSRVEIEGQKGFIRTFFRQKSRCIYSRWWIS